MVDEWVGQGGKKTSTELRAFENGLTGLVLLMIVSPPYNERLARPLIASAAKRMEISREPPQDVLATRSLCQRGPGDEIGRWKSLLGRFGGSPILR